MKIANNTLKHRFEVEVGPRTAFLNYFLQDGVITFTHTEVPKALEGRGIGTQLAKAALEYAKAEGLKVVPQCPFVAAFVQGHPQYQGLLLSNPV